jgi:hypothetical protein
MEDLVARVTLEPSFHYQIIEVHVGYRIEEDQWFVGNLDFRLAMPYLKKSYRLESVQYPVHSGTMPLRSDLNEVQTAVAYDHPFLAFHAGDLILISGSMRFIKSEKESDLTDKFMVLSFAEAMQESSVEVNGSAVTKFDRVDSALIRGTIAIEIFNDYKRTGFDAVMKKYFP